MKGPLILVVLDGFGEAPAGPSNAITLAQPRFWNGLRDRYPHTLLQCSGEDVGLPVGLMGNSEVGHLNIGAGRIVWQEITRIDRAIRTGEFARLPAFVDACAHAVRTRGTLHVMGLVSDGGVHSSDAHLRAIVDLAKQNGIAADRLCIHAFLDGRDTPPRSAERYLAELEGYLAHAGVGRVATICGRYYAMDRDKRWERVVRAYDALTLGEGHVADSAAAGLAAAYLRGENDEFVLPTIVGSPERGRLRTGDAVIFFNFRADRARQLTEALTMPDFAGFARRARPELAMATMTRYREDLPCPAAFAPQYQRGIFPEVVARAGLRQLRIAETEKYAHVTFFFSGGDEQAYAGESRCLVPSPLVATYDLDPAMSAVRVTDELLARLAGDAPPDVVVLNYANADMVGHTGIVPAAIQAISTIDACLSRIVPVVTAAGGVVAITADHGNVEMMIDPETGKPHTAHTTNPVPLVLCGEDLRGRTMISGGRLCDIATTLLPLLGLPNDPSMEGVNLLC